MKKSLLALAVTALLSINAQAADTSEIVQKAKEYATADKKVVDQVTSLLVKKKPEESFARISMPVNKFDASKHEDVSGIKLGEDINAVIERLKPVQKLERDSNYSLNTVRFYTTDDAKNIAYNYEMQHNDAGKIIRIVKKTKYLNNAPDMGVVTGADGVNLQDFVNAINEKYGNATLMKGNKVKEKDFFEMEWSFARQTKKFDQIQDQWGSVMTSKSCDKFMTENPPMPKTTLPTCGHAITLLAKYNFTDVVYEYTISVASGEMIYDHFLARQNAKEDARNKEREAMKATSSRDKPAL